MLMFFLEGGPAMFLIALCGLVLTAFSVTYLLRPDPRRHHVLVQVSLLTLGLGVLGTTFGLIGTLHAVHKFDEKDRLDLIVTGAAESLNNLFLAMLFLVLMLTLTSVGALRLSRQPR